MVPDDPKNAVMIMIWYNYTYTFFASKTLAVDYHFVLFVATKVSQLRQAPFFWAWDIISGSYVYQHISNSISLESWIGLLYLVQHGDVVGLMCFLVTCFIYMAFFVWHHFITFTSMRHLDDHSSPCQLLAHCWGCDGKLLISLKN